MEQTGRGAKYQLVKKLGQWFIIPLSNEALQGGSGAAVPIPIQLANGHSRMYYGILVAAGVTCAVLLFDFIRRNHCIFGTDTDNKATSTEGEAGTTGAGSGGATFSADVKVMSSSYTRGAGADALDGDVSRVDNNNMQETPLVQQKTWGLTARNPPTSSQRQSPSAVPKTITHEKAVQVHMDVFDHLAGARDRGLDTEDTGLTAHGTISGAHGAGLGSTGAGLGSSGAGSGARGANNGDGLNRTKAGAHNGDGLNRTKAVDDSGTDVDGLMTSGQYELLAHLEEACKAGVRSISVQNQDVSDTCKADIVKIKELENACKALNDTISQKTTTVVEMCGVNVPEDNTDPSHRIHNLQKDKSALQNQWLDIQRLLFCINLHLKHNADYQLFFYELEMLEAAMNKLQADVKHSERSRDYDKLTVGELQKIVTDLKIFEKLLEEWGESIARLCTTSKSIYPVYLRTDICEEPLRAKLVCDYTDDKVTLEQGELLLLLDNSDRDTWKCRISSGEDVELPALCCALPPPDINTMKCIGRLEAQHKDLNSYMRHQYSTKISSFARRVSAKISKKKISSVSAEQRKQLVPLLVELEAFSVKYLSKSTDVITTITQTKSNVLKATISKQKNADAELVELIDLLKLWHDVDSLYEGSTQTASRRKQLVRQGTLLDTTETEWESLEEVVEARRQMAEVSVTMSRETATIGETNKYEQAMGETRQTFTITGVRDARDDSAMSMDEAVERGIIDPTEGIYNNLKTGETYPIPVAMTAGFIIVENTTTVKSKELKRSVGVVTVEFTRETRPYTIVSVLDPESQEQTDVQQAMDRGIFDAETKIYTNTKTGERMTLEDAVDSGALVVEYDHDIEHTTEPEVTTKTFAITSVLDRKSKKRLLFDDAVEAGIIIKEEGMYVDTLTGEKVFIVDAMKKQHVRGKVVEDPQQIAKYMFRMRSASLESLDLDSKLSDVEN